MAILLAKNIRKSFKSPVLLPLLKGVDLTVSKGETVAIMGKSGEGKSTLLHILGTLDTPCQGTIAIAGHEASRFNKPGLRNRHIGFVFQSFHLLEDYTALDNILMPAQIARKRTSKGTDSYRHAMDLLDQVGLTDRAHYTTKQLSGGEKQRIGIARALCNNPDLILADEPSGNLDRQNSEQIHELLIHTAKEQGKALVVVTHDPQLASLCDRSYKLFDGQLV